MRDDKSDKTDKSRDRNGSARKERGHRDKKEPEDLGAQSERVCGLIAEHKDIHARGQKRTGEYPDCGIWQDHTEALPAHAVQSADEKAGGVAERFREKGLDYIDTEKARLSKFLMSDSVSKVKKGAFRVRMNVLGAFDALKPKQAEEIPVEEVKVEEEL